MRTSTYLAALAARIREAIRARGTLTADQYDELVRAARASAGGTARAEAAAQRAESARPDGAATEPGTPLTVAAADTPAGDGALEAHITAVQRALRARYGDSAWAVATYPDAVVWMDAATDDGSTPPTLYRQAYAIDPAGVTFGERTAVIEQRSFVDVTAADDDATGGALVTALRLADATGRLPVWQQIHRIGDWKVAHGSGLRIRMTREMGDAIIKNFEQNAIRRRVPLDEGHSTSGGGRAIGWLTAMRWGQEGEGLPDGPPPTGSGSVLYGRFDYNDAGRQVLADEQYRYISPQYALDYVDKETGRSYGPALLAVGAVNEPFLRLRSIQGEPAPAPIVLADGLTGWQPPNMSSIQEAPMTATLTTPAPAPDAITPAADVALAERLTALEARLAEEAGARMQTEARLAEERAGRHRERIDRTVERAIREGVPPAAARTVGAIMLHAAPDAEAIVRLGEGDAAPTVNLFGACEALLADLRGTVVYGARTRAGDADSRPGVSLDDQLVRQTARAALTAAGVLTTAE